MMGHSVKLIENAMFFDDPYRRSLSIEDRVQSKIDRGAFPFPAWTASRAARKSIPVDRLKRDAFKSKIDRGAFPLGPSPCRPAAGVADRRRSLQVKNLQLEAQCASI